MKMGNTDFILGWKITGEQSDLISSGYCDDRGAEVEVGRSVRRLM